MYASNNPQKPKSSAKKAEKGSGGSNGFGDYKFVRYSPSAADKAGVKAFNFSGVHPLTAINRWADAGYKFSVSVDRKNDCVVASLTCNNEASPNYKCILTARGTDTGAAFTWLYWLHHIRFETVWVQDENESWSLD